MTFISKRLWLKLFRTPESGAGYLFSGNKKDMKLRKARAMGRDVGVNNPAV
jgi:hypothetical protein